MIYFLEIEINKNKAKQNKTKILTDFFFKYTKIEGDSMQK
jgi:hypothetical protein